MTTTTQANTSQDTVDGLIDALDNYIATIDTEQERIKAYNRAINRFSTEIADELKDV